MVYSINLLTHYYMSINYWAVLVAAIASMVVGSIWYGPLFGKIFMAASGMDKMSAGEKAAMKSRMTISYFGQFVASLVMFYVLARFTDGMAEAGVMGGMAVAFWAWLGFVVPLALGNAIWGGKKAMFWLGVGNMFVTLLIAGAIIGGWQ